jgi:choline dehydrogenase
MTFTIEAGVDIRAESPNVGDRVIERRLVHAQFRVEGKMGYTQELNTLPKEAWAGSKYLITCRGPIATGGCKPVGQFKSNPGLDRPDIQAQVAPVALDTSSPTVVRR